MRASGTVSVVFPILNEAVLTLYFVYYVPWRFTVSVDDCLFGGSILSEVGELLFQLHYPIPHPRTAGGEETESGCAIYNCTAGVSVTGRSIVLVSPIPGDYCADPTSLVSCHFVCHGLLTWSYWRNF